MSKRTETNMITAAEDPKAFSIIRKMRDNELQLQLHHKSLQARFDAQMRDYVTEFEKEQGELAEALKDAAGMPEYGRETHALDTTHLDSHDVAFIIEKPKGN